MRAKLVQVPAGRKEIHTEPGDYVIAAFVYDAWRFRPAGALVRMTGFDRDRLQDAVRSANECDPVDDGECLAETLSSALSCIEDVESVIRWTTAPRDYDFAGDTVELETVVSHGMLPLEGRTPKTWRKVAIHPKGVLNQEYRYSSGMHASWDRDPREVEREEIERYEEGKRAFETKKAAEAEIAAWLENASLEELLAEREKEDGLRPHLTYDALSKATRRRQEVAEKAERQAELEKLRARIPASGIIIEDVFSFRQTGAPVKIGETVHYGLKIDPFWGQPLEEVDVCSAKAAWAIRRFVERLDEGSLRPAEVADVPPEPVSRRIGYDRFKEIKRYEINGQVVWVGRAPFVSEPVVLDEKGHIARSRKIVQAAIDLYWRHT